MYLVLKLVNFLRKKRTMARTPNIHGGGARTNANGLYFEQTTSLEDALENAKYDVYGTKVCPQS